MAEDVKLVLRYRVEANAPLAYQKPILLMEGDKRANVLQISLFDGEKAVDLTGLSVGGSVLRADGADVAIEGEIDGNVISCVLSEYAYAVAGPFKAFVQLLDSLGDVKRTVLLLAGMVESRGHGPQIDTGKELPSLDDILAQLETMRNVTQAANTAAGDANTAAAAANSAASKATGAANSATTAAGTANAAADRANNAAQNWEEGTVKNAESLGGVPAASYALKTDTAPNASKLGGKPADSYALKTDTAPNASKLGRKAPEYYLTPVNLLDNSNFANLVAQAGLNAKHGTGTYICDRWLGGGITAEQHDGYLRISTTTRGNQIRQNVSVALQGKAITIACKAVANKTFYVGLYYDADGTTQSIAYSSTSGTNGVVCKTGTVPANAINLRVNIYPAYVDDGGYADIYWAALYEGEYTAETLPPYVPKPYAVELAECQRYYLPILNTPVGFGYVNGAGTVAYINIPLPQPMRLVPTVPEDIKFYIKQANGDTITGSTSITYQMSGNALHVNVTASGLTANMPITAFADAFALNLDL